jgi:hypothetical protein
VEHRAPRTQPSELQKLLERLKKPQYAIPVGIVVLMLGIAVGVQPGATASTAEDPAAAGQELVLQPDETVTPETPTVEPTPTIAMEPTSAIVGEATRAVGPTLDGSTPQSDVAGVQSTPTVVPTVDEALLTESTQCGSLQETAVALGVEQVMAGISVQATGASVYPIEYFRCILMATGGSEAYALASSVSKAEQGNMTHIVLVDLWIANSSKQFAQVNLKTAALAAAGQTFAPLATLGGRSEVVVATGQGRSVTVVVAIKNGATTTTGPMTIVVDGPLSNGEQVPGKFQLFLPTP